MSSENQNDEVVAKDSPEEETVDAQGGDKAPKNSSGDVSALEQKLAYELSEFKDRYMRLMADFDNYKKRSAREADEFRQYAQATLMEKLIPAIDTMERAVTGNRTCDRLDTIREGMEKSQRQLLDILAKEGLSEFGEENVPFDVNFHMAVFQEENADLPEGTVIQVFEKGYKFKDKILRHAKVKVSKAPASQEKSA